MAVLPGLGLALGVTALALGAETLQEGLLGVR
ncbi:MAG: hypothetical protein K0Q69_812, partial [Devosia sp.]|nr:hypothetical protein [Devosia sp.]